MNTLVWDTNTDQVAILPEGQSVPAGNYIYGQLYDVAGHPQVVLNMDSYDMPVNLEYFCDLMH